MDTVFKAKNLVVGKIYTVQYKIQKGNYRWYRQVAVWKLIDGDGEKLIWSGRPVCGTQDMDVSQFLRADEQPEGTPCTNPRQLGEYKPDEQ